MSWMQKELEEGESGTQEESIYYYSESLKQWVLIDAMDFEHLLRTMKKLVRGAVRKGQPFGTPKDAKFKVVNKTVKTTTQVDNYTVPSFIQ